MVIIVFGLPGSGKSYFASRLATTISADYINSDLERKKFLAQRTYSEKEKFSIYGHMALIMEQTIRKGRSIVIDATFYKHNLRELFYEKAGGSTMIFIEVIANDEITRQRLSVKRADSDADYEVYKKIRSQWEPMLAPHLVLESTNDNIDRMIETAIDHINALSK